MKAKFVGRCGCCWIRISPGNKIVKTKLGWVHATCADNMSRAEERAKPKKKKEPEQLKLF